MVLQNRFFELLRVALGNAKGISEAPSNDVWDKFLAWAEKQNIIGVCFAGICQPGIRDAMDEDRFLTWMRAAADNQLLVDRHRSLILRLNHFYAEHGIRMMLLKGMGLAACYPHPELRAPGDIDIYLTNEYAVDNDEPAWSRGDRAVAEEWGIAVRNNSEHHTKFEVDGITVENHYDFVNTKLRRSSKTLESIFKHLALEEGKRVDICGEQVFVPSDRLNALFLLRHTAGHFAADGITLKQIVDWGCFVNQAKEFDWAWLWSMAKEYNMHRFLSCMNAICVENLGFRTERFVNKAYDKQLKERVLREVMNGPDKVRNASVWMRSRRWWQHRWKHKICYDDSMFSSFVYSVKGNLGL